jgi:hexosaminidase
LNYSESVNNLYFRVKTDENKIKMLNIETEIPDASIHYTTNDSLPATSSRKWLKPLAVEEINTIHAAVFVDGKQTGKVITKKYK